MQGAHGFQVPSTSISSKFKVQNSKYEVQSRKFDEGGLGKGNQVWRRKILIGAETEAHMNNKGIQAPEFNQELLYIEDTGTNRRLI